MLGLAFHFAAELLIFLHVFPTAPPTHTYLSVLANQSSIASHQNYVVGLQLSLVEKEDPSRVGEGSQEGNKVRISPPRGLILFFFVSLAFFAPAHHLFILHI